LTTTLEFDLFSFMTRPIRINLPFCLYHVFSRTNPGEIAFHDARDRNKFLFYLVKYSTLFEYRIHAFCLMPNHFHLLLESAQSAGLSELMRRLLTAYTIYFNRRHERYGHLFQGRFKSLVVDKTQYLISLSRYIHLNPTTISSRVKAETYSGSSLPFYIVGNDPPWLFTKEILSWFDGNRKQYAQYISEGLTEETKPTIFRQRFIGGEKFSQRIYQRMNALNTTGSKGDKAASIRKDHERKKADSIVDLVAEYCGVEKDLIRSCARPAFQVGKARSLAIYILREHIPWTNDAIAKYFGLKSSDTILYHLKKVNEDPELRILLDEIQKSIKL